MKQKIHGKKVSIKHFITKTSNAFGTAVMLSAPMLNLIPSGVAFADDNWDMNNLTTQITVPMNQMPVAGKFGNEALVTEQFTVNGHVAYCMSFNKPTPPANFKAVEKQQAGSWFTAIINSGYPVKTPQELGVKDAHEAMYATQLAIWHQNGSWEGGFNLDKIQRTNDFSAGHGLTGKATSHADQERLVAAAKRIIDNAAKIEPEMSRIINGGTVDTQGKKPDVHLNKVSSTTVTEGDDAYQVVKYRISGSNIASLTWKTDIPSGTTVTQNGKNISKGSSLNTSDDITVKTKLGTNTGNINIGITATGEGSKGQYVNPKTMSAYVVLGYQNALVMGTQDKMGTEPGSAPAHTSFDVPALGKLKIHKIGENTSDPSRNNLGGIVFNLIDEETGKVVKTGKTAKDGTLEFTNLVSKKYLVREMTTTPEHDQNVTNFEVDVNAGQEASLEVKNTEKPDKPIIRSYTTEVDNDKTKGSRYVDAKATDLTDKISLDNVDAGHNYLIRDTVYDRETGEVLKGVDGKPAVSEKVVHAKDVDLNNGSDRGNLELELTHSKVNLKGLQGHKIFTKVEAFRSQTSGKNAASDTESSYDLAHTGEKLAEETNAKDDVNQTLQVRKPTIDTRALAYNKYKIVNPTSDAQITDKVHVTDLVPGHKYKLHLMLNTFGKDGNAVAYKDPKTGNAVTKDQTFEADNSQMDVNVTYDKFSTVGQNGKSLVTFADITPDDDDSNQLANHNDKDNQDETIKVTNPKLHTVALMDDTHTPNPNRKSSLKDKVSVTDVAPNQPVEIGAVAADSNSNALEYQENGKTYHLMGRVKFTPKSSTTSLDGDVTGTNYNVEVPLMKVEDATPGKADSVKSFEDAHNINKLTAVDNTWPIQNPVEAAKQQTGNSSANWSKFQDTPYAIDTRDLKGKTFTLFEDLYDTSGNNFTSEHDINNKDQQIRVRNPKIVSEALLNDKKTSNPNSLSKLRDKVKYEDVEPGAYLELDALAVDPATGKNLVLRHNDDNEQISNLRGKINFVPKTEKGEVIVPLKLTKVYKDDQKTIDASKAVSDSDKVATTDGETQKDTHNNSSTDRKDFKGNSVVQFAQKGNPDNSAARNRQLAKESAEKDGVLVNPDPRDTSVKQDLNDSSFDIDTTMLRGQKISLVEDLITKPDGDEDNHTVVASDADVNNGEQQVRVTNPHIKSLQTIDDKRLKAITGRNMNEKVPLIDTVEYWDAAPGEPITFQAVEMNKDQKRPVIVNGKYLAGQKTVTPKKSDGSVEVYFNPLTNAPAPYLTNVMLDKDGHVRNRAYLADVKAQQKADKNANKDAVKGDQVENAGANKHDNTQNNGVDDYKDKHKDSNTKNDDTIWQTFTDTRDSMYGTDDISSREDSSAYDISLKNLISMDKKESQNWTAFETALNTAGDIIAEEKDYSNEDQTIKIKNDTEYTGGFGWGSGWNWGWDWNGNWNGNNNQNQNDSGHNGNGNGNGNGSGSGNGGNGNGATVIINNGASGSGSGSGSGSATGTGSGSGSGSGNGSASQESQKNNNGNNSGNNKGDSGSNGKSNGKSANDNKSDSKSQNKVDKSELEKNIDKGDKLKDSDDYKNADQAKKDALDKALENAKKVDQDKNATQEEVDKANSDLTKAISDITGKPEDNKSNDQTKGSNDNGSNGSDGSSAGTSSGSGDGSGSGSGSSEGSGSGSQTSGNTPETVQKAANPSYAQTGGTDKVNNSGFLGFLENLFSFNWFTNLFK